MTVFLTGSSALHVIRSLRCDQHQLPHPSSLTSTLRLCAPTAQELSDLQRTFEFGSNPWCLVGKAKSRRPESAARFVTHRSPLPRGSRMDVSDTLAISSPEHLFLCMHQWLSDAQCIALGYELCGAYARHGTDAVSYHLPPVTSAKRIKRYLAQATGLRYSVRALANVQLIADGSRSIRETQLAMYLGLPMRRGGAGLSGLALNTPIDVSEVTGIRHRADVRWTDISWPGHRVAVEYDSTEWHSGTEKIAQDAARRTLLQAAGYSVVVVTNNQFKTIHELDRIVITLHRLLGKRMRCRTEEYERKKRQLHQDLRDLG